MTRPQPSPNQVANEDCRTPRKSISSPTPAESAISAMSDQELPASRGTNSSSQNRLIVFKGPIGQRSMTRNSPIKGSDARAPRRPSLRLQVNS